MRLDHINIATPDVAVTAKFFEDTLGMKEGFRPPFPTPGAWMYGDDDVPAIVHISERERRDGPTGPVDHIAFYGDDIDDLTSRLESLDIEYKLMVVPDTGVRQIFFMAPFGLKIEVDFAPAAA